MTDSTSTKLSFLVGLLAALVLMPVLALAATTSPAAVQDGATFNATSGPEVTAGEDMDVATNNVFPSSEAVRLGPTTVSHAGQLAVNLAGADTGLPTIRPQASPSSDLRLAHDNTSLSAAVAGGSIDSLALSESATVGDSTRDIEIDTGGTGTTLTVSGLTSSQVTFIDTSGSQNQVLATTSVSGGEASLSVGANAQRDILLATSPPGFDVTIDSTNSSIIEGQTLTVTATITNTGGAQGTQTVTLDAGALGTTSTSVTLASGASQTVTLSLATSTGDDGTVTATVSSDDDSDSAQVEVLENIPNFRVDITNSNAPIDPAGTLTFDIVVENVGAKSDTQGIEVRTGGALVETAPTTLARGATTTIPVSIDSTQTTVGATATVSSDNGSESFVAREDTWNLVNSNNTGSEGPVAISPDGALVAHAGGSDVVVYDPQTEAALQSITVASGTVRALDWHPNGDRLAIGTVANNLHIYDLGGGGLLDTLNFGGAVEGVEWAPDGDKLLAGTRAGTAYILDANTRAQLRTESLAEEVLSVAWSGDAQRFAIGGATSGVQEDGVVKVFEGGGGRIAQFFPNNIASGRGLTNLVHGLAFARDGTRLVAVQQGPDTSNRLGPDTFNFEMQVNLYNVENGTRLDSVRPADKVLQPDARPTFADAVADPTDDRVAVSSPILPTTVYALGTGALAQTESLGGRASSIDWSASGEYIADSAGIGPSGGVVGNEEGDTWRVHTSLPTVQGTVTDSNGNPVGGVTIELAQNDQRVDAMVTRSNGAFTLVAPESGTYTLTAAKTSGNQQIFETKTISVPDDGTTVPFTTTLIGTGISGQVVGAQGDPVPGATVTTNRTVQSAPVNTQGAFAIATNPGDFVVSADAPGYRSDAAAVSVTAGSVTSGVTLQLEEVTGVPISGTVTDPSGDPIDGADVFVGSNQTATNLQGNYIAEVAGTGTVTVTAATAVDSTTRTVTVTDPNGTSGVDFVLERADDPAEPAGNLEIRFENTGALVNNRTVTVRFFDDSDELVATRTTTTGLVSLAGLSQPAPLVAVGEADGLFSRRIVLDDLGDNVLFLLDETKASGEVVVNEFEVRDNTGRFSGGDTQFIIKRAMPLPGETDNIPLRVLGSDLLGADGRFGIALESDVRYRIQLVNDDGDVRDLGPHVVTSAGVVVLEIGEVTFEREDGDTFSVGADAVVTDDGGDGQPVTEITFRYDDPAQLTEQVSVRIYNRSNESQVIVDQTFQPPTGSFGNLTVRKLVLGEGNASADWTVEYSIVRDDETRAGEITVTGRSESLNIPMSQGLQQVLGVGMVIIVGGLFSRRNAAVGAVIVPLLAGALFLVGALSGVVTGAAVAFALTLGVGYNFATRGS